MSTTPELESSHPLPYFVIWSLASAYGGGDITGTKVQKVDSKCQADARIKPLRQLAETERLFRFPMIVYHHLIINSESQYQYYNCEPTMRTSILFAGVAVAIYIAASATPTTAVPDTWTLIPDGEIQDPDIQDLGKWAVMEHVKQADDGIKFIKVVSGYIRKRYKGVNYRFVIDATNSDGKEVQYEAVLYNGDWRTSRLLISFKPVIN
ncbi:hypothetical protein EJB05_11639, partial [Eragrostis curvula]